MPPRRASNDASDPMEAVEPRAPAAPRAEAGQVARVDLLERLRGETRAQVVLLSAPAGSGKTTLLAQWARAATQPVAWLTAVPAHRDPRRLSADLDRLLSATRSPFLLIVDDVDAISGSEGLASLIELAADLPPGGRLALGCRSGAGLGLSRLDLEGGLLRLTGADLAFGAAEARKLLAGAGVTLAPEALGDLLARTEGWPAGLRLAALRLADHPDPSVAAASFGGDERLAADYLEDAVLRGLAPDMRAFMRRTSVLEELSADLCDAVLERSDSATRLYEMERAGLPLVPLDRCGESYRYHRMLRASLGRELGRREPQLVPSLHRRASDWYSAAGEPEGAVRHAIAAGDPERAAGLVWHSLPALLTRGDVVLLRRLLDGFEIDRVAGHAPLALASAWCATETQGDLAGHYLSLVESASTSSGDGGDAAAAAVTTLRALLARDGLSRMAADAAAAFRMAEDEGPWRAYSRLLEGVAHRLRGDVAGARVLLEEGVERAGRVAPSVHALCLSQLALMSLDEGASVRALVLAHRARAVVEEWGLGSYGSAALTYAAGALALAHADRAAEARESLAEVRRVLPQAVEFSPWLALEALVAVADAALTIGEDAIAREALAEGERFVGALAESPMLRERFEQLGRRTQPVPEADRACLSSITAAEMRVLRLLPTHHSFREIGELLFLSRFTVKSHAHSLYRKMGASSRSEAVERSRQLNLLGE